MIRNPVKLLFILIFAVSMTTGSRAQSKNEVGLLLGRSIVPTSTVNLNIDSGVGYQVTYARLLKNSHRVGFGFEVPFVALPSQDVHAGSTTSPRNYASIFLTPGLRATVAPGSPISPWASLGGGYARFDESTTLVTRAQNTLRTGTNKAALQYGGGADFNTPFKILFPLVFRAEVRDFYTGQPRLNDARSSNEQHNVIVSGGIVLRF